MKVQEVIMKAMAGKLMWFEAAEILGVTARSMRRWRQRMEEHGYDGLYDYRKKRPSPKQLPVATLENVLRLYQDKYPDFNIRHFHVTAKWCHSKVVSQQSDCHSKVMSQQSHPSGVTPRVTPRACETRHSSDSRSCPHAALRAATNPGTAAETAPSQQRREPERATTSRVARV